MLKWYLFQGQILLLVGEYHWCDWCVFYLTCFCRSANVPATTWGNLPKSTKSWNFPHMIWLINYLIFSWVNFQIQSDPTCGSFPTVCITPWSSERWGLRVWGTQKIRLVTIASHGDGGWGVFFVVLSPWRVFLRGLFLGARVGISVFSNFFSLSLWTAWATKDVLRKRNPWDQQKTQGFVVDSSQKSGFILPGFLPLPVSTVDKK